MGHHLHKSFVTIFSVIGLIFTQLLIVTNAWGQQLPPEIVKYPDSIFMNATIITMDVHVMNPDPGSIVEAMAVRDEEIIALGTNQEIMRMSGPDTKVYDLKGKTVMPAFVESHDHPMGESEQIARELYNLRSTPEGYALKMDVAASADETLAKVARAMELLLSLVEPAAEEWINISLVHAPELGFATPADVSTLMTTPRLADVKISKSDITEIVPEYPFVLTSSTDILDAPDKGIWYHITAGANGAPVITQIAEFE